MVLRQALTPPAGAGVGAGAGAGAVAAAAGVGAAGAAAAGPAPALFTCLLGVTEHPHKRFCYDIMSFLLQVVL